MMYSIQVVRQDGAVLEEMVLQGGGQWQPTEPVIDPSHTGQIYWGFTITEHITQAVGGTDELSMG